MWLIDYWSSYRIYVHDFVKKFPRIKTHFWFNFSYMSTVKYFIYKNYLQYINIMPHDFWPIFNWIIGLIFLLFLTHIKWIVVVIELNFNVKIQQSLVCLRLVFVVSLNIYHAFHHVKQTETNVKRAGIFLSIIKAIVKV